MSAVAMQSWLQALDMAGYGPLSNTVMRAAYEHIYDAAGVPANTVLVARDQVLQPGDLWCVPGTMEWEPITDNVVGVLCAGLMPILRRVQRNA